MSVLNQSGEEQVECPLCMEPLEVDDLHFYPCTCGYQICRFCWNRIREGENGLCPACRKAYPENPADFTPLSQEQVAAIKTEKKAREQKRRNKTLESRRALANVRVVQNNLVFVVGLPVRLADPEILKRQEYFGKYGKIHKVVINQSNTYAGSQVSGPSASAYVTYVSSADALRAIQGVNNATLDGRVLKGSLGTTKYCANFMKNQPCPKADCMYLHELGDPKASFTKEEMHAGLHQVYERKLHAALLQQQRDRPDEKNTSPSSSGNSSTNAEKSSSKDGNQSNFIPTTVITSSHINVVNSSNSSKSKKDSSSSNGSLSSSSNGSTGSADKEAWPSLGASPPAERHAHKPYLCTAKSQENGTSESSSPTQQIQQQAQTKNSKDNTENSKTDRKREGSANSQTSKKNKSDNKTKQKNSNSINVNTNEDHDTVIENKNTQSTAVFESNTPPDNYLTNDIDELESDRHSLLENHDLLENSDHNLLDDDDNSHNLLADANSEAMMMQRQREMLAGLSDNKHIMQMKSPLVNGFGLIDRDTVSYMNNDVHISQMNQSLLEQKDMLLRERSRSEMLMRQNELLARQHSVMVDHKHFMPSSSIGLEPASELLGANYHANHNILPPFGMRVDNSIVTNSLGANSISASISSMSANNLNALGGNTLSMNALGSNTLSVNALGGNTLSVNALSGNTLSMNSLGGNTMSMNSLGGNTMPMNSLGGNTMSVNSLGNNLNNINPLSGNISMNALGGNAMNVNPMGGNTMSVNSLTGNSMPVNHLTGNSLSLNNMVGNMSGLGGSAMGGYLLHNQQLLQQNHIQQQNAMVNGFDTQQSGSEGRYKAENMDKFFTDFNKAQQMRRLGHDTPRTLHMALDVRAQHRMNTLRGTDGNGGRAAGDGDDDLDFDPFKETQKALAEMMETEMLQNTSGDSMERVRGRRVPPGFSDSPSAHRHAPPHPLHATSYTNSNHGFSDWTQMDPAIMSTSVNFPKAMQPQPAPLSQQQQELFARFNHLNMGPNGLNKLQMGGGSREWAAKWGYGVPLPPGFAPPKAPQHPAECIDAK